MQLDAVTKMTKGIKAAVTTLNPHEVRFLVGQYYAIQEYRKSSNNQVRALDQAHQPKEVLNWLAGNMDMLENQIKGALAVYSKSTIIGKWAESICGIGPVISAGLQAHIDIEKAPTVGHIWSFAGLDPNMKWEKGQKRPYNADLKMLCWKIGESFVKVSGNVNDIYGQVWLQRKELEWSRNKVGAFALQAREQLEKKNFKKDSDAKLWMAGCISSEALLVYEMTPSENRLGIVKKLAGAPGTGIEMLCPAHIHARAKRYAVKLFLSHFHHVLYESIKGQAPPKPYILTRPEHVHYLAPPN